MKHLLTLTILLYSLPSYTQSPVLADGQFDEWSDYPVLYVDAAGDDGASGIDFGTVQIASNETFLFFAVETGVELNLQDFNELALFLDTDNNPNTGLLTNGIGAELVYTFGERTGSFYHAGNSFTVTQSDIGLVSAPTVTSDRFEIAINRTVALNGLPLFPNTTIKVLFRDQAPNGDGLPATGGVSYTFSNEALPPLTAYSIQRAPEPNMRVLSYNVLFDGLFDPARVPAFTRILQATQPDIIGFQEIYDYSSAQVANQVESILPSAPGQQWYHAKEGPDCHAISRYPILKSAKIPGFNQNAGNGAFLIDLPGTEKHLLLIVAHPPCCDNNPQRQVEVDQIMAFLREAKNGNGPIPLPNNAHLVVLGDMNLVGDRRQLQTLLTGDIVNESSYGPDFSPDWDGSDLIDSNPYTTGLPFVFTWYQPQSSFSPGKLDYIIYGGSNLFLQNNFALFTPALPADSLSTYGLLPNDVVVASDHLPLIADFKVENLTAQQEVTLDQLSKHLTIHPNPADGLTSIAFELSQKEEVVIQLIYASGEAETIFQQKELPPGAYQFQLNTSALPEGLYYLRISTSSYTSIEKMMVFK